MANGPESRTSYERSETSQTPYQDHWAQKYWRPGAAIVYLVTIIFDYIVRPLINNSFGREFDLSQAIGQVTQLDPSVQAQALEIAANAGKIAPILPEYYHLAFGAILGAAAWTRGKEKLERVRKGV